MWITSEPGATISTRQWCRHMARLHYIRTPVCICHKHSRGISVGSTWTLSCRGLQNLLAGKRNLSLMLWWFVYTLNQILKGLASRFWKSLVFHHDGGVWMRQPNSAWSLVMNMTNCPPTSTLEACWFVGLLRSGGDRYLETLPLICVLVWFALHDGSWMYTVVQPTRSRMF